MFFNDSSNGLEAKKIDGGKLPQKPSDIRRHFWRRTKLEYELICVCLDFGYFLLSAHAQIIILLNQLRGSAELQLDC